MNYEVLPKTMWNMRNIYDPTVLHLNCFVGLLSYNACDGEFWKMYGEHVISDKDYSKSMRLSQKWIAYRDALRVLDPSQAHDVVKGYLGRKVRVSHIVYSKESDLKCVVVNKDKNDFFKEFLKNNAKTKLYIQSLARIIKAHKGVLVKMYVKNPAKDDYVSAVVECLNEALDALKPKKGTKK